MKKKKPIIIATAVIAIVIVVIVAVMQSSNWSNLSYEAIVQETAALRKIQSRRFFSSILNQRRPNTV